MLHFLFLFFLFLLTFPTYSQTFEGGPLIGLTASQIDGDRLSGYNKAGGMVGIWVGRHLNSKWSFRAELKYIMKGAATNKTTEDYPYPYYRKTLHYIEIPIFLSYKLSYKFKTEAGFSGGYMGYATVNDGSNIINASSTVKKYEIALNTGFAYRLNDFFDLHIILHYSLFPISNLPGKKTIWGTNGQYNNVTSISIYYRKK